MYKHKLIHLDTESRTSDPLSLVDPLKVGTSLPTTDAVGELSRCFDHVDESRAFLCYAGISGVRFAGCLVAGESIDQPIAFCPISADLVVGSALWRVEVLRQLGLCRQIAFDPSNDRAAAIWLKGLSSGARDTPPWLYSLACVPICGDWDGTLQYPVPFCPGRFERMARQPQARLWLETHSPDLTPVRRPTFRLTVREKQVLRHLCSGLSEGQAARHLSISVHTVHVYVKQIYRKFEVESRSDLMALFIDRTAVEVALNEV